MVDLATTVQWWWECDAYGQPLGGESGAGIDLYDCKARFKTAWARIRFGRADEEILRAFRKAEAGGATLARYDRKRGK
jgi:hypothetical protein